MSCLSQDIGHQTQSSMESQFCRIGSSGDHSLHKSNESFFMPFNYNQTDEEYYLNIYDQLLVDQSSKRSISSSDWDSNESIESEEEIEDIDDIATIYPSEESLEIKSLISFCQYLPKFLPQICDLDQNDPVISEEMEAIEKESVHMDLLTCSAATANCYRESSKASIRSKYGKWSCSGKHNPDIGLGPLSHLFADTLANETSLFDHNINHLQHNYDICVDYNRMENNSAIKEMTSDGFGDNFNHNIFYPELNQQNQSINQLLVDPQNHFNVNEVNSADKCYVPEMTANCQPMYAMNHNYVYNTNDNYGYDPNPIQAMYYQ